MSIFEAQSARESLRSPGRLPDFLIVGAAKAGTTTLYGYLREHPRIYMCREKEPSFFDGVSWDRGLDWYRSLFAGASDDQLCGEASTNYARWPSRAAAAPRIAAVMPDVRLIYLIRDPVDRAYSHYLHDVGTGAARSDRHSMIAFEEYLKAKPVLLDISDYLAQIRHLLNWFPRAALLILQFDELIRTPTVSLQKVFRFLGVEDLSGALSGLTLHENDSRSRIYHNVRRETVRRFRQIAAVRKIYEALPLGFRELCVDLAIRSPLGRRVRRQLIPPAMRPGTRRMLIDRFSPSVGELGQMVGADLSAWLDPREPIAIAGPAAS
jgi:hypothetical protein